MNTESNAERAETAEQGTVTIVRNRLSAFSAGSAFLSGPEIG